MSHTLGRKYNSSGAHPLMSSAKQEALVPSPVQASAPIPFNRFCKVGTEFDYVQEAINNMHISGDGPFTRKCQAMLETALGVPKVLLTTSCTDALEMAALLLDIAPGDEVIVPSFTFVSTVNAFVLRGARPVFVDIRPDTLNLDETQLERLITPRTRAIVPVHYAGVGCEMDSDPAQSPRATAITVVEDNAHGLFGKYRGRTLGTFGALATQSFHETKNFTCGEGGALLINDPRYIERAEIIREKGTNRSRFFRGQVDKYTWVDSGIELPAIRSARRDSLRAARSAGSRSRPSGARSGRRITPGCRTGARRTACGCRSCLRIAASPYHMFYLLLPSLADRQGPDRPSERARHPGVFHYLPLHLSEYGRSLGGNEGDCPVCEDVSDRLLRLPFYNDIGALDQFRVIDAVLEFHAG